ncbi:MAG: flagellar export protein FliJ [Treponema sp.]|jgi:flagellar FliJ protein|nr:flagellar export protein FliJ [Treponema sp.]
MKAFSFPLEKILKLRTYREQEAKIDLGRAIGVLTEIENRIRAVAEDRYRAAAERFAPDNGALKIISYEHYIQRLDRARDQLLEDAAQAELVVEEKRNCYLEASRDRKVLDKLKEKREKEYRQEVFAGETKDLDDISGGKDARMLASGDK